MKILLIIITFCALFGLSLTLMLFSAIKYWECMKDFEIEITEDEIMDNLRL